MLTSTRSRLWASGYRASRVLRAEAAHWHRHPLFRPGLKFRGQSRFVRGADSGLRPGAGQWAPAWHDVCMDDADRSFAASDVITALGHEVFQIDTRMAGYDGITAGYLIKLDRPCLGETSSAPSAPVDRDALGRLAARSAPVVSDGLGRLGIGPAGLATVVVAHLHLDHAGGAGDIAAMCPAARL